MKNLARALLFAALCLAASPAHAQGAEATQAATAPADYSIDANWLCRPGRDDACAHDQSATVISADGTLTREPFRPNAAPPIDCFYVYPTVSLDPGENSDLVPGREEIYVAEVQFARFAAVCRTFAPMYRQNTLASLRARMAGRFTTPNRELAYQDVRAAWRRYLAHDNHGRGVVVIGHSQGAALLIRLIAEEIDGKAIQAQLVSAIILGANVIVPDDADVGGSFQHVPACRTPTQTGCVISYVSFRDTAPPPPVGLFAHAYDPRSYAPLPGMRVLCTNPANLAGGPGTLHSYFSTQVTGPSAPPGFSWTSPNVQIDTPFVSTPGLASAQCRSDEHSTYLAIHVNVGEDDVRTHDIPGDVRAGGRILPDWGLHLIDVPEAMGDLIGIVGRQGEAHAARRR
ncbi:MAG TPA: DUF3089 domain-containing protein [Caulobacterales bacterium]|nr:DUF3089 domain-containing protein [Caulobacterales bacterium]